MKNILIVIVLMAVLSSCGISMGVVLPKGNDEYTLTASGRNGFISIRRLRKKTLKTIQEYANERSASFNVISQSHVNAGIARWPEYELTFQLVRK
jgi:hypothetical protein